MRSSGVRTDLVDALERFGEHATLTTLDTCAPATAMSADEITAVLAHRRHPVDASPPERGAEMAPPAFVSVDGEIWLPIAADARPRRDVAEHGALTVVVTDADGDDRSSLLIEGPAREVTPPDVEPRAMTAYEAKYGQRPEWAACWLVIRPVRVLSNHVDARSALSPVES